MEKHVVAVPADTSPYDFGALLHREAVRMGLPQAKAVFFVIDGGVRLWNIYRDRFEKCSKAMLDFYHLSQHLHALGAALHGADTVKTEAWCGKILHGLKHKSPGRLFKTLDKLLEEPPSADPAVQEAIREQNAYFRNHAGHMDYAANAGLGVPVGSGSVESQTCVKRCLFLRFTLCYSKYPFCQKRDETRFVRSGDRVTEPLRTWTTNNVRWTEDRRCAEFDRRGQSSGRESNSDGNSQTHGFNSQNRSHV